MDENLFDWTPYELQCGRQFQIGDRVTGPKVVSDSLAKKLIKGSSISGNITGIGWKYIRTDNGDIWRDDACHPEAKPTQGTLF